MRKHPTTLVDATREYAKATSWSVHFLIEENEWMFELQTTKHVGEQVTISTQAELKKVILHEVSSLEIVLQPLYSRFGTVHKVIVHLNG